MPSPAWYRANGLRPPGAEAPAPKPRPQPSSLDRKRARQARYYLNRKARGLCKLCPNPVDGDATRCEACRQRRSEEEYPARRARRQEAA